MRENAIEKIKKMREYNEWYINKKPKVTQEYCEGDLVGVWNFEVMGDKLAPAYRGPHTVVCKLRNAVADIERGQVSQPYQST